LVSEEEHWQQQCTWPAHFHKFGRHIVTDVSRAGWVSCINVPEYCK